MRTKKIMRVGMLAAMVGMMAFSLGAPAWASTGQDGPTSPKLGDPVTNRPEVQIVTAPASATFTLTITKGVETCTTAAIPFNVATSSTTDPPGLAEYINSGGTNKEPYASGTCTGVTVKVSRSNGTPYKYKVTFTDPTNGNVAEMTSVGATVTTYQDGQVGGWIAPDGDGVPSTVSTTAPPHGGYSSLSDYCLQCHAVHKAPEAEFALMRQGSVTATCQTCHALFGTGGATPFDSNNALGASGLTMGSAAARSAYDLGAGALYPLPTGGAQVRGHQIGGLGNGLLGDYSLADGPITIRATAYLSGQLDCGDADNEPCEPGEYNEDAVGAVESKASGAEQAGIYCASCHTPHGEFGQLVNDWRMSVLAGTTASTTTTIDVALDVAFTGFTSADVKKTLRVVNGLAAGRDLVTRIASRTDSNTIVLVDPVVNTGGAVYLGDEGAIVYLGSKGVYKPYELDYDGTAGYWKTCLDDSTNPEYAVSDAVVGSGVVSALGCGIDIYATPPGTTATSPTNATTSDAEGQSVYVYGYKLLSSGPNHQFDVTDVKTYGVGDGGDDKAEWCGTCHTTRWNSPTSAFHNHPGSCTRCHGNPDDQSSYDFPHTSTVARLLTQLPDALCIRCHSELP